MGAALAGGLLPKPNQTPTQSHAQTALLSSNFSDRPEWHLSLAAKLPGYAAPLPLTAAEVDQGVADNLILSYGLDGWITGVREHGTACTASLQVLSYGIPGATDFVFPVFVPPALPDLPASFTGVKAGALQRTFDLVAAIKRKPGYTDAIGLDLGIIGPELPPPPPAGEEPVPRITVTAVQGIGQQSGRVKFFKDGHEGVWIESRRGNGDWEFLATTTKSPHLDTRPLLVAGQAEVREYRARFWDEGQPNGGWCAVAKATISP